MFVVATLFFFLFSIFFLIFILYLFHVSFYAKYYWKKRNIPCLPPLNILKNDIQFQISKSGSEQVKKIYLDNRDKPLFGIWAYATPYLMIQDVDLIKKIFLNDFQHFHDRGLPFNEEIDFLEANLFYLSGSKWRNLRSKITPVFTSNKTKMMIPIILECGKELQHILREAAENEDVVEMKDVLSRFTTDVISSCAFGIQTNSLKNPNAEFRKFGKMIFSPGFKFAFKHRILMLIPFLQKIFTHRQSPEVISNFFLNAIKETMEFREKNDVKRNDFLDLMIQLKNKGSLDNAESDDITHQYDFTMETIAAQAFGFFSGGFETSSTVMIFSLYEMALNLEVQKRLQTEIDTVLAKCNRVITWEAIKNMEYLDCVINESLRKYPPGAILARECTKDYTFPETHVTIKKGMKIIIPVIGIHNNPEYYPNPEKFDPDRFRAKEKAEREKFFYLPFGEGPRKCIGLKFGLVQTKVGLISILSKYNVQVSEKTQIPMKFDPTSLIPAPASGMNLKITKRKFET